MNPFSEYAFMLESDDYPKTEATFWQLKGKIDTAAFAQAFADSIDKIKLFSCNLVERKEGMFYIPYWIYNEDFKNRLVVEDCRHLVGDDYNLEAFTERYYAPKIIRRLDLANEFPFNCHVLRVQDDTYILGVLFHHSILDPFKAFMVLTNLFARYHELVKGQWPTWVEAEGTGDVIRKKKNQLIKPLPMTTFAKEQLMDVWVRNSKSKISPIAVEKVHDFKKVKGRYSLMRVIEDEKLIAGLVERAVSAECTLNDLFFAVSRKVLSDWNLEKGKPADRFRFMLVTSLLGRAKLPKDSGAGLAGLNVISVGHGKADLDTLMHHFKEQRASQLSKGVDIQFFNTLTKVVAMLRLLPMKTRTGLVRPMIERVPVTFEISNIGSIWPKKIYPDGRQSLESRIVEVGDFKIDALHSTISIAKNLEWLITVRTHNKRTFFTSIFDKYRFRRHEAEELTDRFFKELENAV